MLWQRYANTVHGFSVNIDSQSRLRLGANVLRLERNSITEIWKVVAESPHQRNLSAVQVFYSVMAE